MIPWELIGVAVLPGDGGELRLTRRGMEFSLRLEGYELMNSRAHASEDALAELACAKLVNVKIARVLVGGLGMGFTAAAALRLLGPKAQVVVAELSPDVIEWNTTGPLSEVAGHPTEDRRTKVVEADVADMIHGAKEAWDAMLLDVDNSPEGLTRTANDRLYSPDGLAAAMRALRPGGVLAVWSAAPSKPFTKRLKQAGFQVSETIVRARTSGGGGRGGQHTIWLAVRPPK